MSSRLLILALTLVAVAIGGANLALTSPDALRAAHARVEGELARAIRLLPGATAEVAASGLGLAEAVAGDPAIRDAFAGAAGAPDQALLDRVIGAADAAAAGAKADGVRGLVVVANAEGKAIFRRGADPEVGAQVDVPLVADALDGARSARLATVGEAIYRLAAAPVAARDRAGAVAIGHDLDDGFARAIRERIGADVTFVHRGKVLATSLGAEERGQVLAAAAAGPGFGFGALPRETFSLFGVLPLPLFAEDATTNRARKVPLQGLDGVEVIASVPTTAELAPIADAQKTSVLLAGVVLVVGLLCTALARGNRAGREVGNLADVAERALAGDATARAQEYLPGDLGRLARALNKLAARARATAPAPEATQAPGADLPSAEAIAERFPFGAADRADEAAGDADDLPEAEATALPEEPSGAWGRFDEPPAPSPAPRDERTGGPALASAPMAEASGSFAQPEPQRPAPPQRSQTIAWDRNEVAAATAALGGGGDGSADVFAEALREVSQVGGTGAEPFNPEATVVAAVPEALLKATSRAAPARQAPADPDEAHFRAVFDEFLATRERCGESVGALTWEKFEAKLRRNRDQLVAKYGCRTVRFTVYVKEGRAALKAAPVRD